MIEYRRLLVSEDEFKDVILNYIALEEGEGNEPCVKAVWDVSIVQDTPFAVHVQYQTRDGRQATRTLDENGVTAAFIGLCLTCCIPISKISEKTVKKTVGGIAMDMTIKGAPVLAAAKGVVAPCTQQAAR